MKFRLAILISSLWLLASGFASRAALSPLPATNEVNLIAECASFDTSPQVQWIDSMASYISCMYPQYTNHIWSWSHSGSGLQGDFENDEAGRTMPFFHSVDPSLVAWNYSLAGGDNGGYTSNQVVQWFTNIMKGPQLVWNGTALTNEGITFPTVLHLPIGSMIGDASDGGGQAMIDRNNAATNLAGVNGLVQVDMWHDLWTNGWSADVVGARKLGFAIGGGHPNRAGYLVVAHENLIVLGAVTNIGSCVIDFNAAIVRTTNAQVISGLQLTGNVLSWTNLYTRMPGAWDVGAGTNGCDDAFGIATNIMGAFSWTVQVTNLPAGSYRLAIDGSNVVTLTSAQLAAGWNMYAVTNGPLWNQRKAVLNAKRDQEGNDPDTLLATHDAGTHGVGGYWDLIKYYSVSTWYPNTYRGSTYITQMAPYVADMKSLDVRIHDAAQQTNHVFTLTLLAQWGGKR